MPMTRPLWLDERASLDALRMLGEAESLERLRFTQLARTTRIGGRTAGDPLRRYAAAALAVLAVLGVIALYVVLVLQLAGRLPAAGSAPFS
jgi:hypothetical protein